LNTRYFHSVIKWRRSRNGINKLRENGQCYEDQMMVKGKVRDFFKDMFSGGARSQVRLDNAVFTSISDELAALLTDPLSHLESVQPFSWKMVCW